jgi:cyclic nucleotide gated channel alpha 1
VGIGTESLEKGSERSEHALLTLSEGQTFGASGFFAGNENFESARSKSFTTVYKITREDFLKVLASNPDDYEKFMMVRDQFVLYRCSDLLRCYLDSESGCRVCGRLHDLTACDSV